MGTATKLRSGDVVRLRGLDEITATLDEHGRTDNLPFMREMLELQGQSLLVESRADKTCDTINLTGCNRQMTDTVHLVGARCTGRFHGGCQAYCLLFFNESWLEPTSGRGPRSASGSPARHDPAGEAENAAARAELEDRLDRFADAGPDTYRCQATQLLEATEPLTGRGHYLDDLRNRNVPPGRFAKAMAYLALNRYQRFSREHLPPVYDFAAAADCRTWRARSSTATFRSRLLSTSSRASWSRCGARTRSC